MSEIPGHSRPVSRVATLLLAVLAAGALARCAMFRRVQMAEIHQDAAARPQRNPVILIHGFLGSRLRNSRTHEIVWSGAMNAMRRGMGDGLDLPIDNIDLAEDRDDLVADALVESLSGVQFYGALLRVLRDVGGYRQGDINDPRPGDTLFVYGYDWRRDNVESAVGLAVAIERIKIRLHAPEMRFDLVAHSMGGLLAQYYLEYGAVDVIGRGGPYRATWAGTPNIGRMILIGTPLRGTMSAFRILNSGLSRTMPPAVVFTMPSLYQLLPSDGRVHLIDPDGGPVDVDLYDADDWVRNGWSVFNPRADAAPLPMPTNTARAISPGGNSSEAPLKRFLQSALDRARAFHDALGAAAVGGSVVPIHLFGSDCIPTLDCAVLERTVSGPSVSFDDAGTPDRDGRQLAKQMLVPGDGTVTAGSLLAMDAGDGAANGSPGSRSFASTSFFCGTHGSLPGDQGFQDNLFYVLFHSPERPATYARAGRGR